MSAHPATWSWSPPAQEQASTGSRSLADRLQECTGDRSASARAVTREAAKELRSWLSERPQGWGLSSHSESSAGLELERGWGEWARAHGWRGPCALLLDSLRRAYAAARTGAREGGVRGALSEELEHWLLAEASAPGARLASRRAVAEHAAAGLDQDESVLVHGYSETVAQALCAAQEAGLRPSVTVGAGAPDQSGKRLARHLAEHDVEVRVVWDAVALATAAAADRIWIGTEALGAGQFTGLVGTGLLLEGAARAEVPVEVLTSADKWVPGGALELPVWGDEQTWNLWSRAPEGATLESQPFEITSCDLVTAWITERGRESLADFSLRAMRIEAAPACAEL